MKLYRYDHYNVGTGKIADGQPEIPVYLVQVDSAPEPADYTQIATGSDIITAWHNHALHLVGTAVNFMDWKCLRDQIKSEIQAKAGSDYSNYIANLTAEEKAVAAHYVPTTISDKLGFPQLIADSGGVSQAFDNIDNYLERAEEARYRRYKEIVGYVYRWLGKVQALQAEDQLTKHRLRRKFIKRGVLRKVEDSVDGFADWVQSEEDHTEDGLKKHLEDNVWTLIAGAPSKSAFCQKIVDCAENGIYPIP